MHIGIRPVTDPSAGGTYQYGVTMMEALCRLQKRETRDRFTVLYHPAYTLPVLPAGCVEGWSLRAQPYPLRSRLTDSVRRRLHLGSAPPTGDYTARTRPDLGRAIRSHRIELMLYPSPLPESFESGTPFVIAIHDLQHRLQPEFPEVSSNGQFELREYLFRNGARHATLVLADSEVGREDILNFYEPHGATPDRVKVLPFLPAVYLSTPISPEEKRRVAQKYRLPDRYLFYPANFWPHKNHARIVEAVGRLNSQAGLDVKVVFTGTSSDELARKTIGEMRTIARHFDVEDAIHRLGYIEDGDMSALYAGARGLVMPTFFGPTNIPVLEAWACGCPVLTSDIRGIREQVGRAGLLVRPDSVDELANGIRKLWTDDALGRELVSLGHERLSSYRPEDYRSRLEAILEEAKARVSAEPPSPGVER